MQEIKFPNDHCIEPSEAGTRLSKANWAKLGVILEYRIFRVTDSFDTAEKAAAAAIEAAKKYERDHFPGGMAHAKRGVVLKFDLEIPDEEDPPPIEYYGLYETMYSPS
jgi:hypothetical protein